MITAGYYATPDPDDPGVVTCWRYSTSGRKRGLRQWSGGAKYGTPTGPSRGRPSRPYTDAVRAAVQEWFNTILTEIRSDPAAAGRRFAEITGRCCICGRKLTDLRSVVEGIGPDCRKGWRS